ncbi:MAG: hypothetical protein WCP55_13055, partial [Lentisphaerota bacterium]
IEKIVSEESGCRPGFYINCNVMPEMCRIEPISNACEWSEILEPDGKRFGAGIVVFENRLGGRIITFAASDPARLPMSFQRQAIIHSSIKFIAQGKSAFPLVTGGAHLMPMCFEGTKNAGLKVVVLNGSPDPATPILHFTRKMPPLRHATLLKPLEKPLPVRSIKIEKTKGTAVFTIDRAIPHMSFAVLEWDFENNAIF